LLRESPAFQSAAHEFEASPPLAAAPAAQLTPAVQPAPAPAVAVAAEVAAALPLPRAPWAAAGWLNILAALAVIAAAAAEMYRLLATGALRPPPGPR
jgi:hypothetical protein